MNTFYLGCDVSKGYADFIILDELKNIFEPVFQLDDTFEHHQVLFNVLKMFFEKNPSSTLFAAVESTGGYENNWLQTMKHISRILPLQVARVNPMGINHNNKAAMKRTTTDRISAFGIAEYQIHHPDKIIYNQDDEFHTLRRMVTTTRMMVKAKVQFLNELESLIYVANPGLVAYRKYKTPKWLMQVLLRFPDADSLTKASVEELSKIAFITPERAKKMIADARHSVASATDELTRAAIVSVVESIIDLETRIAQHTKLMQKRVQMPQVELLRTFKSIGALSAIELLIEIGCIERFPTVKHLASFFGLHPIYKQSGDGTSGNRMSKQGRRKPRATLYMVALTAIHKNPLIQQVYCRELQKGKAKMSAIGVCMHKILRIVYGILKNNKPFDPEIDRRNQQKGISKKKIKKQNNVRRFQKENAKAPISRKQTIKRKERELSQSDNITKYEIDVLAPKSV